MYRENSGRKTLSVRGKKYGEHRARTRRKGRGVSRSGKKGPRLLLGGGGPLFSSNRLEKSTAYPSNSKHRGNRGKRTCRDNKGEEE